jgi:hypothetical protein
LKKAGDEAAALGANIAGDGSLAGQAGEGPSGKAEGPTEEMFGVFKAEADTWLDAVGASDPSTEVGSAMQDLKAACGDYLAPCVAHVGGCLAPHTHETQSGKITVDPDVCQCFAKGLTDGILIPDQPNVDVRCEYSCLESISAVFNEYLASKNGEGGERAPCKNTFSSMASATYGTLTPGATDALTMKPLDDPKVMRAGDVLVEYVNSVRRDKCPAKEMLHGSKVVWAKEGEVSGGKHQFRLEAVLGGSQEFVARVSHLDKVRVGLN